MRPHASPDNKAAGLSRARMLMKAKLGWLAGYPSPQGWVVVPEQGERPVEPLVLTRDHLRRATYTSNKLRGEFPRALPKLVGDADAWHAAVSHVLATLKPSVHQGEGLPSSLFPTAIHSRASRARAAAVAASHPALRGLVDALSWALATRAGAAPKALAWVEREAAALTVAYERLGAEAALVLGVQGVYLAEQVGPKALAPLMRLMREPCVYDTPTAGAAELCQATQAMLEHPGRMPPSEPKARLPTAMAAAVCWLQGSSVTTAKRWLALLERCDLVPLLAAWSEWWPPMRELASRGYAVRNREHDELRRKQRLAQLTKQVFAQREQIPGEVRLDVLLEALRPLAEDGFGEAYAPARRVLERLAGPELAILRAGLAIQWSYLHASPYPWWKPKRLPLLLRAFDQHLRDGPLTPARLAPWIEETRAIAARGSGGHSVDQDLLEDHELEAADVGRFFSALRWVETHAPTTDPATLAYTVLRLLEALHDAELAARLAVTLHQAKYDGRWIGTATLRAAWRACEPEPADYASLVRALERIENETGLSPASLVDGVDVALGPGPLGLLRALLLDPDLGPLVQCGRKLAVLQALGDPLRPYAPSTTHDRAWILGYPAALHDDLEWLCEQTPDVETLATKVLGSIHHSASAIAAERRAIAELLPHATPERSRALRTRLATLERRQAEPAPSPSPAKLERLRVKLRRRGALARLTALEQAADELLPCAVGRELGQEPAPPWALQERVLALLVPLQREPAPIRQLARTIMRARAGSPPWDLREHRANAAFLAMLRERGIDPTPWLDGIGTIDVGHGKSRMKLALEDDPLEVFHMGRHFGTCLSPGQCNFFSVFANAADINKRVLYARDARGGVLGRRLLCLTQEGAVLAFHSYCHDAGAGFDESSAAFAQALATAMGTVVVGRGTVPRLVAPDWYDDGPVDIAGQFDVLKDGSDFRAALTQVLPDDLQALVSKTFDRPKLDEVLAPMVLALPELGARSDLALTLLALMRHPDRLPLAGCRQLAQMLTQVGAASRATEVLAEPMVTALWQQQRQHRFMDYEAAEDLARLAPSRALELLRRTRSRGTRSWDSETKSERLVVAGVAMEALRRPKQAVRMYQLAQTAYGDDSTKRRARARLVALK